VIGSGSDASTGIVEAVNGWCAIEIDPAIAIIIRGNAFVLNVDKNTPYVDKNTVSADKKLRL
jgi:hypothetical protein